ncbi:MAG: glycosyltransferase [Chloroflexota bacterium]
MPDPVPHDIRQLGDERAKARRAHDWATADRLKAEIEAAGWRVVDAGTLYSLERKPPEVVEVDGEVRYGSSEAVPSVLESPASGAASVVIVADERASLVPVAARAVLASSPAAQVIVVANDPPEDAAGLLVGLEGVEIVPLARRLGAAAALNAGIRRAAGEIVVLLDPGVEVQGDLAADAAAALADQNVGVAGLRGLATDDLVHFEITAVAPAAAAVDRLAIAFRRADYRERGPLDEHFERWSYLDAWWSLALRDVGEDAVFGVDKPRSAALLATGYSLRGEEPSTPDARTAKKHRYRFLKSFAARRDLVPEAEG